MTHRPTWLAVQAERAVSRALGGSCSMPLAVHGSWRGEKLWLRAVLGHPTQPLATLLRTEVEEAVQTDLQARALGERAAKALRSHGAAGYLAES